MLSSREDAEDVLQEVFAAAFNAILGDDREINVRPWLYRIARNRSLNHLRRTQPIGVDSMDVHFSDGGQTTADKVHKREEFRLLLTDVQGLPETQRTALLLREIDALSYDQIADAMETTVPSVKSLLVRARVSLAEAAESRLLSCEDVRLELGEVAEGIKRITPPVRRHLKTCDRCAAFRGQLRETNKALAAMLPVGPLLLLKKLILAHLGTTATATGGGATAAGSAASGFAGSAATTAAAGGAVSAGVSAVATKTAAGLAAAAIVTAGAVEVRHVAADRPARSVSTLAAVPAPAVPRDVAPAPAAPAPVIVHSRTKPRPVANAARAKTDAPPEASKPAVSPTPPPAPVTPPPPRTQTVSSTATLPSTPSAPTENTGSTTTEQPSPEPTVTTTTPPDGGGPPADSDPQPAPGQPPAPSPEPAPPAPPAQRQAPAPGP
jgi:RNA polymerase sigma factor (sigma-70 family)